VKSGMEIHHEHAYKFCKKYCLYFSKLQAWRQCGTLTLNAFKFKVDRTCSQVISSSRKDDGDDDYDNDNVNNVIYLQ